jgi:hypothetical protein
MGYKEIHRSYRLPSWGNAGDAVFRLPEMKFLVAADTVLLVMLYVSASKPIEDPKAGIHFLYRSEGIFQSRKPFLCLRSSDFGKKKSSYGF